MVRSWVAFTVSDQGNPLYGKQKRQDPRLVKSHWNPVLEQTKEAMRSLWPPWHQAEKM